MAAVSPTLTAAAQRYWVLCSQCQVLETCAEKNKKKKRKAEKKNNFFFLVSFSPLCFPIFVGAAALARPMNYNTILVHDIIVNYVAVMCFCAFTESFSCGPLSCRTTARLVFLSAGRGWNHQQRISHRRCGSFHWEKEYTPPLPQFSSNIFIRRPSPILRWPGK